MWESPFVDIQHLIVINCSQIVIYTNIRGESLRLFARSGSQSKKFGDTG